MQVKSDFTYIAGGIAGAVVFLILIVLLVWMICIRATRKREPKKSFLAQPSIDPNGSQVKEDEPATTAIVSVKCVARIV